MKFPQGMCVLDAERERGQRDEVVRRGAFEVWRVGTVGLVGEERGVGVVRGWSTGVGVGLSGGGM